MKTFLEIKRKPVKRIEDLEVGDLSACCGQVYLLVLMYGERYSINLSSSNGFRLTPDNEVEKLEQIEPLRLRLVE